MKIVFDNIIYFKGNNGGISNYWYELTDYLLKSGDVEMMFYEEFATSDNFHRRQLDLSKNNIVYPSFIKPLLLSRMLPVKVNINGPFIFHSSYYRNVISKADHKTVTTVHDFTHDYYAGKINKVLHNKLKYDSIKKADGIICVSKNTYYDLQRFCPLKPHQKVEVIYNGVSDSYFKIEGSSSYQEKLSSIGINSEFLLYVGSRAAYKNFDFAIDVLRAVPKFKLVIVGSPLNATELKKVADVYGRLIIISNAGNDMLNILYNNAFAFLYPSYYEGFGIPIIEAMRAGCPVMALKNSSITEVGGHAALLFENPDVKDFRDELNKLENNAYRDEVAAKGIEWSQQFSWRKCCQQTHQFYEELY